MRHVLAIVLMAFAGAGTAQGPANPGMTQERLHEIVAAAGEVVRAEGNRVAFRVGEVPMLCISDPAADRMRIVAPVKRIADASPEELIAAMRANFTSVLDVRYALSSDTIVVAYLHPLSPLTREQVLSAIAQVAMAAETFGTAYSGGGPSFRGF